MTTPTTPPKAVLQALARQFPNVDAAAAEIARLSARLTLPKGTIHVISDVHGENAKLRHLINNASGTLRPWVERLFAGRKNERELTQLLTLLFYPKESLEHLEPSLRNRDDLLNFTQRVLADLFEIIRPLARRYPYRHTVELFPVEFRALLEDLLQEPSDGRDLAYTQAIVASLVHEGRAQQFIRLTVRLIRNLTVSELIIGGDCWDRGPRGDRVVEYLRQLPNVAIVWGNHDVAWLGACLGHEALIASVLRISLRYRRLSQLEEGYGITMQPLEHLVREVYDEDPAECYVPRGQGLREVQLMARMQKAAAIMLFKLEGQVIARNPQWNMDHRRLLHRIDHKAGTVTIDGETWPLRDRLFPTIDPAKPYELSAEEQACIDRIRESFLSSQVAWDHMRFLVQRGSMYLVRDDHLIFHGCLPVDAKGEFLPLEVDGQSYRGRELFDALERVVVRVLRQPSQQDTDWLWYLWCGPSSPLFGKDRITTFEADLVADKRTHAEVKNPYFQLIHEVPFCDRILAEFGVDSARGLIVNGHVPVKIEHGELPLKKSGKAITIDGAFSEAYGDRGYTLVLEPERTLLAQHHHFESVEAAVRDGIDIIPQLTTVRDWGETRRVAQTEEGREIHSQISLLETLIQAYRTNDLREGMSA